MISTTSPDRTSADWSPATVIVCPPVLAPMTGIGSAPNVNWNSSAGSCTKNAPSSPIPNSKTNCTPPVTGNVGGAPTWLKEKSLKSKPDPRKSSGSDKPSKSSAKVVSNAASSNVARNCFGLLTLLNSNSSNVVTMSTVETSSFANSS